MQNIFNKGKGMIKDNPPPEERFGKFEYYRIGETPVRLVYDKENRIMGSYGLNAETGELVIGSHIKAVMNDPYSEEITEEEFYALCETLVLRKKNLSAEM